MLKKVKPENRINNIEECLKEIIPYTNQKLEKMKDEDGHSLFIGKMCLYKNFEELMNHIKGWQENVYGDKEPVFFTVKESEGARYAYNNHAKYILGTVCGSREEILKIELLKKMINNSFRFFEIDSEHYKSMEDIIHTEGIFGHGIPLGGLNYDYVSMENLKNDTENLINLVSTYYKKIKDKSFLEIKKREKQIRDSLLKLIINSSPKDVLATVYERKI